MKMFAPIRVGVAAGAVFVSAAAVGQMPATPPTTIVTNPGLQTTPSQPQPPQSRAEQAAQPAQVQMDGRMLTVAADNSSLNQILREIARVTGMKITGGVTDERVYGSYGPAEPAAVLAQLIGGTGSNMMIVMDAHQAPQELVLTPRGGGPTPPNPNADREREREDLPPQRQQHFQQQVPPQQQFQQPQAQVQPQPQPQQGFPQQPQQGFPPVPAQPAPGSDTTTQQSPNGVKTPQEIYDQLMKMQQQQQTPKPPQ
jgi:hypothetical protein